MSRFGLQAKQAQGGWGSSNSVASVLRWRRFFIAALCCLVLWTTVASTTALIGEPVVDPETVFRALATELGLIDPGSVEDATVFVITQIRLPRIVLATMAGLALGIVGLLLQAGFNNPVADPSLLGISQAAAFAVAVTLLFPNLVPLSPVLACLIGSAVAGGILVVLAGRLQDPIRLILVGVIVGMFISTLTTVLLLLADPATHTEFFSTLMRFTTGSISGADWQTVAQIGPWVLILLPIAFGCGRLINVIALGDESAAGLGLSVTRARAVVLGVSLALLAPVVAVTGPIAFVALLSPHVARRLISTTNAWQTLPLSALVGATTVTAADAIGRLAAFPIEVPAGLFTILVAGPVAIALAKSSITTRRSRNKT